MKLVRKCFIMLCISISISTVMSMEVIPLQRSEIFLPPEVVTHIISKVVNSSNPSSSITKDIYYINSLKSVNKDWNAIIDDFYLWNTIINSIRDPFKKINVLYNLLKNIDNPKKYFTKNSKLHNSFKGDASLQSMLTTSLVSPDVEKLYYNASNKNKIIFFSSLPDLNENEIKCLITWYAKYIQSCREYDLKIRPNDYERNTSLHRHENNSLSLNKTYLAHIILTFLTQKALVCNDEDRKRIRNFNNNQLIQDYRNCTTQQDREAFSKYVSKVPVENYYKRDEILLSLIEIAILQKDYAVFEVLLNKYNPNFKRKENMLKIAVFCNNKHAVLNILEKLYPKPVNDNDLLYLEKICSYNSTLNFGTPLLKLLLDKIKNERDYQTMSILTKNILGRATAGRNKSKVDFLRDYRKANGYT